MTPPPLLPSSTSSLVPGHVGIRQHPSTVEALPPLCSVHSWCKGVGALRCILSSSCFPGLLSSPCNARTGFACSSMPCYVVFANFLETSLPHVPHLALLGSSALSPMHFFPWFFQLLSEAKVFRCFSCILTWWILSPPFDLHTFPQSG